MEPFVRLNSTRDIPYTSEFVNQSTSFFRMSASFIRKGVDILFFNSTGLLHLICHTSPQLSSYDTSLQAILLLPLSCLYVRVVNSLKTHKTFIFIIQHCYCSSALNLHFSSLASVPRCSQLQYRKFQLHLNFFDHESQYFCASK